MALDVVTTIRQENSSGLSRTSAGSSEVSNGPPLNTISAYITPQPFSSFLSGNQYYYTCDPTFARRTWLPVAVPVSWFPQHVGDLSFSMWCTGWLELIPFLPTWWLWFAFPVLSQQRWAGGLATWRGRGELSLRNDHQTWSDNRSRISYRLFPCESLGPSRYSPRHRNLFGTSLVLSFRSIA